VHVKNILQKLDARDRTAAVTIAARRGFIRLA
jgi:DNA-binding NarL/FixJ family response regulator